jgi:hypothetical protein
MGKMTQVDDRWVDLIQEKFPHIQKKVFWKAWRDKKGNKIKGETFCSFAIPNLEEFFGKVHLFVTLESLTYVIFQYYERKKTIPNIQCTCVQTSDSVKILPIFHFLQAEQGWLCPDGTVIINKYVYY